MARSLDWLSALLEGEGCFSLYKGRPIVMLRMTDRDVVESAAEVMQSTVHLGQVLPSGKPIWETKLAGARAISLMEQLLGHMHARRRARIEEILDQKKTCNPRHVASALAYQQAKRSCGS